MAGLGIAAILFALVLVYVSYEAPNRIPGRSYYDLYAEFSNADNLAKHYQVRMGGRHIGQVLDPHVEDGRAVVKLRLDADMEPLRSDTRLRVRPRSVIGVRFVELVPGTRGEPLAEGGRIPASQTSATVQLDSVLDTFDPQTRAQSRRAIQELGGGIAARGGDLGAAAEQAPTFLDGLRATAGAVNRRAPGAFGRLVRGANAAALAAEPVRDDIADGFGPEADALAPFVDHADAVHELLEQAPPTFTAGARDLAGTRPLVDALDRFAQQALPTLRAAPDAFARTARLLREARPGLRAAESTLELADGAVDPTLHLLRTVDPALPSLDRTFAVSDETLATLAPRGCDLRLFDNFAKAMERGNVGGNILRLDQIASDESLYGRSPAAGRSPTVRHNPYPAPCEADKEADR